MYTFLVYSIYTSLTRIPNPTYPHNTFITVNFLNSAYTLAYVNSLHVYPHTTLSNVNFPNLHSHTPHMGMSTPSMDTLTTH